MPALTRQYSDINLSFTRHPVTGDIAKLTDYTAVKRSVENLILTNFYERPFNPRLGTGIRDSLFEPMDMLIAQRLQFQVTNIIEQYEKRAQLQSVIVSPDYDHNGYGIDINFTVLNLSELVTISVFLERTR